MKRHFPVLLVLFVLLAIKPIHAQTLQPNYGAPAVPVSVCNGNATFSIKIIGSFPSCPTGTLNITLPTGYVYVSGSASLAAGFGSVSEASASGNLATLNLSGIPDSPDSMVINYQAYATCGAIGVSNNQVSYTLNTTCLPPNVVTSNTFSTQSAALNITSITNNSYSGAPGDVYTRAITITNNGLGSISQLTLADTSGSGLYVYGISVNSGWGIGITKSNSGSDTVNTLLLSGPSLAQGQSIVVTETVKLVSRCFLQSRFYTYFGCFGNACTANSVSGSATAGATINTAFTPSIKVVPTVNALTCRNSPYTQTIGFTDTGAVKVTGLSINLFNYNGLTNGYANFRYKYGANGVWNALPLDSSRLNGPALPCITGMPDTAWATIPVINPGDTVFVAFEEQDCIVTTIPSPTILIAGLGLNYSYGDACGDSTATITSFPRNYMRTQMGVLSNLPANMKPATNYQFIYNFSLANSTTYTVSGATGSKVRFSVILPNSVDFSGVSTDITLTSISTGLPIATPSAFAYNAATHTIDFTYSIGGTFTVNSMQNSNLTINNLTLNCAAVSNGNTVVMNCFMKTSTACGNEEQLLSQSNTLAFICPVACNINGGISFNDFTVRRINYGLPDNDNNGVPDPAGTLDFTKVRTNYTLPGDTLELGFYGVVTATSPPAGGFKYGLAVDTISAIGTRFTNLYATIQLFAAGSSVPFYTYNNLPITGTTTIRRVSFNISALNALSPLPPGHTTFNDGDSIVLKMYYKTVNNPSSLVVPVSFTNKIYISNVSNPPAPPALGQYFCGGNYIGNCTVISYSPNSHGSGAYTLNGGGNIAITIDNYLTLGTGIAGSKPFVNEYRPISIYDSLSYTVPAGYSFVSASAAYSYTKGINSSTTKTVPITPVNPGSNPLIFDIGSLFTSGVLPMGDQGSSIIVTINVAADCYPPALSNNIFYFNQVATPGYNTNFPGFAVNSTTGSITFIQPTLTPTTAAVISSGTDTASWDIQLDVSSIAPANNVWMAKDAGPSGVTILNIQQISAIGGTVLSTITPTGGIYQLGAFTQATSYYRVNGVFTSCIRDSLQLAYGLICSTGTYPTSVATATSFNDLELSVIAQQPSLQINIITQPTSAKNFCDTIPYELEVSNAGLGAALGLNVQATLPVSGSIYYIPNTFQFQFPAGTGTYVSIPDAQVNISGNIITFTVPASVLQQLNSSAKYRIQFGMNTSCGFTSGGSVLFSPNGTAYCGQAAASSVQQGQQIQIIGAPSTYNSYTLKSKAFTLTRDCGNTGDVLVSYHFKIINQGPLATSAADGFSIQLQAPWELDTTTISYPHNPAGASFSNVSANTWYFKTGVGVIVGDSVQMYCTLRVPASQVASLVSGSNMPINESAIVQYVGFCSATGQPCPISQVILASKNTTTVLYDSSHLYYTNPPVLAVTNPPAVCVPYTIDLTAPAVTAGSSTGLSFSYYTDPGVTTKVPNPAVISSPATFYIVGTGTVTGCGTDTLPVTALFNLKPALTTSPDTTVCVNGVARLGAVSPGSTIQWTGLPAGDTVSVVPPESIFYQVIATSAAGCKDTAAVNVQVETLSTYLNASPNPTIEGKTVVLTTTNQYQVVAWLPAAKFSNQTAFTQSVVMSDSSATFSVVLKSPIGCVDTATVTVVIDPTSSEIFVPNAFTPNGDGKNDVFTAIGPAIKDLELRVFNQWGQQIFATQDKTRGWTGLFNGEPQPAGVYIYVIKATLYGGTVISKKGTVLLIR